MICLILAATASGSPRNFSASGAMIMNKVPIKGPRRLPAPPIMTMQRMKMDTSRSKLEGTM